MEITILIRKEENVNLESAHSIENDGLIRKIYETKVINF